MHQVNTLARENKYAAIRLSIDYEHKDHVKIFSLRVNFQSQSQAEGLSAPYLCFPASKNILLIPCLSPSVPGAEGGCKQNEDVLEKRTGTMRSWRCSGCGALALVLR